MESIGAMETVTGMMETITMADGDTPAPSTSAPDRRKRKAVTFAPVDELCFTYDGGGGAEATRPTGRKTNANTGAAGGIGRRDTPHRRRGQPGAVPRSPARTPGSRGGKRRRLVETGAVRVRISPNPRRVAVPGGRGGGGGNGGRLVETGAVRVTRHTTPRRLNAAGRRIWSPPPPSSAAGSRRPRSEVVRRVGRAAPGVGGATPPSGGCRRNGLAGGHRFRAAMSPPPKSAAVANLSRTLF